ncbi:MAG: insulinase family protein [Deltaproteobacteria bacterium]|nr:insulinase family protein [Deltaproteobacteria bacterium]
MKNRPILRRLAVLLALMGLTAGCAAIKTAGLYEPKLKPYDLQGLDFPMPSGLRLFFQEDHDQASVVTVTTFGSGATQDPIGKEGLAHLVEHLIFRARHGEGVPTVWETLDSLGSVSNAFTNSDQTTYFAIAPKAALEDLMRLDAARIQNPLENVTEEVVKVEIEVVRNELRQRVEMEELGRSLEDLNPLLFPEDHPYHRSIIGSHESLTSITLADVQKWVKENYRPDNATTVYVGDFDPAKVPELLGKTFPRELVAAPGSAPDAPLELAAPKVRLSGEAPAPPAPPMPYSKSIKRVKGPVTSTNVLVAWSLPGSYRGQDALMQSATTMLNNAVGAYLRKDSLHDEDKVEGMGCFPNGGMHGTQVICIIQPTEDMDPEVVARKAIDGAWEAWDVSSANLTKMAFLRMRTYRMADVFLSTASLMRALEVADSIHYTGEPNAFSKAIVELNSFNDLEMRQFAYKYLNRDRAVAMIIEPLDKDEKEPDINLDSDAAWSGALLEESEALKPFFEKLSDDQVKAATVAPDETTMKTFRLANQLKVVLKKHGNTPFVQTTLRMGGGDYGITPYFAGDYVWIRDDARPALEVAGREGGGTTATADYFSTSTPSGNLPAALDILATKVETVRSYIEIDERRIQFETLRRQQKLMKRNHRYQLSKAVAAKLMPQHPLGIREANLDAVEPLTEDFYKTYIDRVFAPANATLFVVGDIDLAEAEAKVRERFEKWRPANPGTAIDPLPSLPSPPKRTILLADRPDATQVELTLACQLPRATADTEEIRDVLSSMLSDDLFQTIRKQSGASYGVRAYINALPGGAATLGVGGNIMVQKAIPAIKTILSRMQELKDGGIDPARLNKARWKIARSSHSRYLGLQAMTGELMSRAAWGAAPQSLAFVPDRLSKVNAEVVAAQLEPCIGNEVIGLVGPASLIKEALGELGGAIEMVEVEAVPKDE